MHRLDRGAYAPFIWLGLFLSGVYVLATPPDTIGRFIALSDPVENMLAAALMLGSAACLVGSALGDPRDAYRIELYGLAVIVLVLGILAVLTDLTLIEQFTLAGSLGACVQLGSVRLMAELALALRKMNRCPQ